MILSYPKPPYFINFGLPFLLSEQIRLEIWYTPRVRSRSEDRRARPGGSSRSSGAPKMTAGSLRHRQRSAGGRTNCSATSRWPQNAAQHHVSPSAARSSALQAVSRILVTTSGELILLPVWERHPKLNLGQRCSQGTAIPTICHCFCAFFRHFALSESKMAAKTTSGSGFDLKFRLLAPGFLLES